MSEHEYSPTEKIKMAEEFNDTPFWRLVFEPYIQQKFQEGMIAFIDCNENNLKQLQAAVKIYDDLDSFVENYIESQRVQIEMDKTAEGIELSRTPDDELESMIDQQD